MFEKGDKFIHYTKYGSVNIGEVKDIHITQCIDTDNKVIYDQVSIITTNNIILSLDGTDGNIYKINNFLTDDNVNNITNFIERAIEYKENVRKKLELKYNTQVNEL